MLYFFISLFFSICSTLLIRWLASYFNVVDFPDGERKRHQNPVPLLGGISIFVTFWIIIFGLLRWHQVNGIALLFPKLVAAFVGSVIVLLIGIADDLRPFSALGRLILTSLAILITTILGGGLEKITHPLGGFIQLSTIVGGVLVFFWLLGMTYTTKILDGLDGLATGVVAIGAFMIYFLTSTAQFYQPNVGLVALIFAGTCLGFLVFNFYPAKIFLGESGSLLIGFTLGILATLGGGKLATALLVMAVPILDVVRVVYVRFRRKQPIFQGDREHLHFQLLNLGMSERWVVLAYYVAAAAFGITTLFLQSYQKLIALLFLVIAMVAMGWKLSKISKV